MPDAIIDNRPINVTIRHYRGTTFAETFGFNFDLTGGSAKFTIRRAKTSRTHLFQANIDDAAMTISAETPHTAIPVTIPAADQDAWEGGTYFYDLEITYADDTNDTLVAGVFEVFQDIT